MDVLVGPVHFGNVHQTLDALLDFNEGTVVSQVGDLAEQAGTGRVTAGNANPRIVAQLLHAQGDAVLLGVELEDLGGDFVAHGQHFGRVTDTAPGQVGDVQQAIDTTEVHECAVVGDVLDDTLDGGAFLEVLEELFAILVSGGFEHGTTGHHDVVALAIQLDDLEFKGLAFVRGGVLDRTHVDQGARQEGAHAIRHDGQAALDLAGDGAGDQGVVVQGFFQEVPGSDALGAIARQARGAVAVFQHFDGNLNEVAFLDFELALIIQEFFERNIGFRFQAGIDHDEIVIDEHHFCSDDFALTHFLASQGFFKKLSKRFHYGENFHATNRETRSGLKLKNMLPAIATGNTITTMLPWPSPAPVSPPVRW